MVIPLPEIGTIQLRAVCTFRTSVQNHPHSHDAYFKPDAGAAKRFLVCLIKKKKTCIYLHKGKGRVSIYIHIILTSENCKGVISRCKCNCVWIPYSREVNSGVEYIPRMLHLDVLSD